jgi:hypothetical protein
MLAGGEPGDVEHERKGAVADLAGDGLDLLARPGSERDRCALSRQRERDAAADTPPAPRDEADAGSRSGFDLRSHRSTSGSRSDGPDPELLPAEAHLAGLRDRPVLDRLLRAGYGIADEPGDHPSALHTCGPVVEWKDESA